jgi:glycosyltransferase involved in cell wall biosynthesis
MWPTTPKVSVILPAYNAASFIGEAVGSLLAQTFQDFEALVIDDGSTDETYQIVETLHDPRIRLLRNPTNLGLVASLNRGIEASAAALIARMDADDWSAPDRLATQVEWLERYPRLGVLSCYYETFDTRHPVLDTIDLPVSDAEVRYDLYAKSHCFCHPAALLRREALDQCGGYKPKWFPAEDRELWMRMLETWHGANVPRVLHRMRHHATSVTSLNLSRQAALVIDATAEALERRKSPADVGPEVPRVGWARGELFVAFGRAADGDGQEVAYHLERAVTLDEGTARRSFEELLSERTADYMHHSGANVLGCQTLVKRVFDALPASLSQMGSLRSGMESQIRAVSAYYHANLGEKSLAQREAIRALAADRRQWHNRGLIKLALGAG